jgi:hypothetical protein
MKDFDSILNRVCGSVLSEVFGKNGNLLGYWKINSTDCYKNPLEFDDALVDAFQWMGALLIENRILTRFYRKIGAKYSRSDDLNFAEEVRRARIEFERVATRPEPSTARGPER